MNTAIEVQIIDFLQKNNFLNPVLLKCSETLAGGLYIVQENNINKATVKIVKSKKLEELYQLNQHDFMEFIMLHTMYVNDLAKKIAAPRLISINNSFVQSHQDFLFYMMKFIPGENKESSCLKIHQKNLIAQVLATIHQTDFSQYNRNFFTIRAQFLARAWQSFLDSNGLNLIEKLAASHLNYNAKKMLSKISHAVTYDSILEISHTPSAVLSHADIKPKNVIWNNKDQYFIIDWDELCLMRAETDFIDTVTSWAVRKEADAYYLDKEQTTSFRRAYSRPLSINEIDIYTSAAKWMFWTMTCYCFNNEAMLRDSLLMLKLLDDHCETLLSLS